MHASERVDAVVLMVSAVAQRVSLLCVIVLQAGKK